MDYIINTYIFLVVKFAFFYLFLFLLGRSVLFLFKKDIKIDENKILNLDIQIIYPIVGLIFLGNYLVIFNFFLPIKSNLTFLVLSLILINIRSLPRLEIFRKLSFFLPIYLVLLISSYNIYYHYDAGLYHLSNQLLIRENNIILGISNIYGPYGVGSIYEYVSSFFWIDKTFVLLHFLNLIFIGFLYELIYSLVIRNDIKVLKNIGISLLLYSILDNFGYMGGRNGFIYFQGIGKQDVAVSVLFLFTTILIIYNIKTKKYDSLNFFIISLFSLFIYQLKVSGIMIFSFYIFYLICLSKNMKLKEINKKSILLPSFLAFIWIVKSILSTGCLIFPLTISCFDNISWVDKKYISVVEDISIGYSVSYSFGESFMNWFTNYIALDLNRSILLNFVISYLVISFIFFSKKIKDKYKNIYLNISFILFLNLLFYIKFGPDPRYIMALQILLVALIGLKKRPRIEIPPIILFILFTFALLSFVRLDSYREFNFFSHPSYEIPQPELVQLDQRYAPKEGDQCWATANCSANHEKYFITQTNYFKIVKLES